jgi:hypothetical protein
LAASKPASLLQNHAQVQAAVRNGRVRLGKARLGSARLGSARQYRWFPKPIGEMAMADADRQARYRATWALGETAIRTCRPADHRSRARRWHDAVAELMDLQAQCATWLDTCRSLRDGITAEALQAICNLDLDELQVIEPPRGFGHG